MRHPWLALLGRSEHHAEAALLHPRDDRPLTPATRGGPTCTRPFSPLGSSSRPARGSGLSCPPPALVPPGLPSRPVCTPSSSLRRSGQRMLAGVQGRVAPPLVARKPREGRGTKRGLLHTDRSMAQLPPEVLEPDADSLPAAGTWAPVGTPFLKLVRRGLT